MENLDIEKVRAGGSQDGNRYKGHEPTCRNKDCPGFKKMCPLWMICDLAIMMSGHVIVPLYPNTTAATMQQVLEHSEAKLLYVGRLVC